MISYARKQEWCWTWIWHCCEKLCSSSVNFFEDTHFIMGGLPAHLPTPCSVKQFLNENSMTPVPHPPYSPDLTLRDFFCSPGIKRLKGNCFANVEEVK